MCYVKERTILIFTMKYTIECEQEVDGRWIVEISNLPGVLAYGITKEEAISKAQALALRVVADKIEHRETTPDLFISFKTQ